MKTRKQFGQQLFFTGLILFILVWLTGLIPLENLLMQTMDRYNAEVLKDTIFQYLGTIIAIIVIIRMGARSFAGFNAPTPARSWLLIWPLIIMSLLNIPEHFQLSLFKWNIFLTLAPYTRILFCISAGLVEEVIARSMVSAGLIQMWGNTKKGIYLAALISSMIFGAVHIGNYFVLNFTPLASLTQILFAMFFGVFFFALFVRTKSVWPGIVMHALVDLCAHLDIFTGTSELIPPSLMEFTRSWDQFLVSMIISVPLAVIGLFMLRKTDPDSVLNQKKIQAS